MGTRKKEGARDARGLLVWVDLRAALPRDARERRWLRSADQKARVAPTEIVSVSSAASSLLPMTYWAVHLRLWPAE